MRATQFETRHQVLLHLLLVGLCSLSYLYDGVDIVWAGVRNHSDRASWERTIFGFGTLVLIASAMVETWANADVHLRGPKGAAVVNQSKRDLNRHPLLVARILLVLAIGLLLPLSGTILLLTGETILITRLFLRGTGSDAPALISADRRLAHWSSGFRAAAAKWGLAVSMVAFVWTLQDRVAEIGAACSVVLWLLLNVPMRNQ